LFSLALSLTLGRATFAEDTAAAGDAENPCSQPAEPPCAGCQGCGGGCCDGCWAPLWTVRADALLLDRSRLPSQTLLVNGVFAPLFNANQFDEPVQVGWEIDVTRRLNCDWDVEARYFDLGGQSANSPTITSSNGAGVLYAPTAQGLFFPPVNTSLSYTSRLQDVELNARRGLNDWLTVLAGFRYLDLDDRILVKELTVTAGADATQKLEGFNSLVGFQIGADASLWRRGSFSVDALVKAGIYDDLARNALTYDSTSLAVHSATGASADRAAFCGEIGITLNYELTQRLSVRGGYELLWLDGVALASQQLSINPPPILRPAAAVATGGDLFYNGAFVGLEYRR
jgi:hypothetical protein